MNSGRMRQQITIQQKSDATAWGGVETWSVFTTCYAEINFSSGGESNTEGQPQSKNTGTARIRYNVGVKPQMRILYSERYFEIQSVVNVREQNREMIMTITEVNR